MRNLSSLVTVSSGSRMAKGSSPNLEDIVLHHQPSVISREVCLAEYTRASIFRGEVLEQWKHPIHCYPALACKRSFARRFLDNVLQVPRRYNILLANGYSSFRNRGLVQLLPRPDRPPYSLERLISQSTFVVRD